jgi:hypothetical protein
MYVDDSFVSRCTPQYSIIEYSSLPPVLKIQKNVFEMVLLRLPPKMEYILNRKIKTSILSICTTDENADASNGLNGRRVSELEKQQLVLCLINATRNTIRTTTSSELTRQQSQYRKERSP